MKTLKFFNQIGLLFLTGITSVYADRYPDIGKDHKAHKAFNDFYADMHDFISQTLPSFYFDSFLPIVAVVLVIIVILFFLYFFLF